MSLATVIANLRTRRDDVAAKIAALSTSGLDKPTSTSAGLTIDFEAHKAGLYAELREIEESLRRLDAATYNGFVESEMV